MNILSLHIDRNNDCRTLIISDSSLYKNKDNISNMILEIKPPGKECFITFDVVPGFKLVLNCSTLKLCCTNCPEEFSVLPDGNYEIKISYDPNLKTMAEFNYFRTCQLFKKYIFSICSLYKEKCDLKKSEYEAKVKELYNIKEIIKSSEYSAEECLDVTSALELYEEANNNLNEITNGKKCSNC